MTALGGGNGLWSFVARSGIAMQGILACLFATRQFMFKTNSTHRW